MSIRKNGEIIAGLSDIMSVTNVYYKSFVANEYQINVELQKKTRLNFIIYVSVNGMIISPLEYSLEPDGKTITFTNYLHQNDFVIIKYLTEISVHNNTTTWGEIVGNLEDQTDLYDEITKMDYSKHITNVITEANCKLYGYNENTIYLFDDGDYRNLFCAVAWNYESPGNGIEWTSNNGSSWTGTTIVESKKIDATIGSMIYFNGYYIYADYQASTNSDGYYNFVRRFDLTGIHYNRSITKYLTINDGADNNTISGLVAGNGVCVITGNKRFYYSLNGEDWIIANLPDNIIINSLSKPLFDDEKFIVYDSANNNVIYSYDGINWYVNNNGVNLPANNANVAYGNGKYVTRGYYSNDGIVWNTTTNFPAECELKYLNDRFIATCPDISKVYYSLNGTVWNYSSLTFIDTEYMTVAYGGGIYLGFGHKRKTETSVDVIQAYSFDGVNWVENTETYYINKYTLLVFGLVNSRTTGIDNKRVSFLIPNGLKDNGENNNYKRIFTEQLSTTVNFTDGDFYLILDNSVLKTINANDIEIIVSDNRPNVVLGKHNYWFNTIAQQWYYASPTTSSFTSVKIMILGIGKIQSGNITEFNGVQVFRLKTNNELLNTDIPSQIGNNGLFLSTTGSDLFWNKVTVESLGDVELTNLSNNNTLIYDGSKWVNRNIDSMAYNAGTNIEINDYTISAKGQTITQPIAWAWVNENDNTDIKYTIYGVEINDTLYTSLNGNTGTIITEINANSIVSNDITYIRNQNSDSVFTQVPLDYDERLLSTTGVFNALKEIDMLPDQTGHAGQFLSTDGNDTEWKSIELTTSLSELDDVELTNMSNEQILQYDLTSGKWINVNNDTGTEVTFRQLSTSTDTSVDQLIINIGTQAQIDAGIQSGTITDTQLSFATDNPTYAELDSPTFTGVPTAPTAQTGTNTTQIATTAFVSNAMSGVQTTSNLVTSVSSSSTDTQYPSAKCVYDIVGDIETLLANI